MKRTLLAGLAGTLVLLVGSAAGSPTSPERPHPARGPAAFLSGVVRLLAANRYAEAWTSLNPLQQSIAPLQTYVACELLTPTPGHLVSMRTLGVRKETVRVLLEQPPVPSTAVTFALRIAGGAHLLGSVRILLTAHAVAVGTRWTWIMPPGRVELYRQGCGTDPATTP